MSVFQVQSKDVTYRIHDGNAINGLQNFSWDPAFNEEFLEELGNVNYVATSTEPEVSGSFDVLSTGSAYALLSQMIMTLNGSGGFTGYLYASGTPNTGTITSADLEFAQFDIVGPKRTNGNWTRSEFFPRVFLSSISFSGDAAGNAQTSYGFEGQLAEVYRSPSQDIVSKPAIYASATTLTLLDTAFRCQQEVPGTGTVTSPTHTIIAVLINENVYDDSFVTGVDDAIGVGPITITMAATAPVPVGARITVLCYADTPGAFPVTVNPVTPDFVRANSMDIWLVATSTVDINALADGAFITQNFNDSDLFLRVQSFDINVDLRRETLRQIKQQAGSSIYYRGATYPLQVSANASTFESDLDDWRKLINELAVPVDAFDDKLDLAKFTGVTYQLVVFYYYNGTPIQAVGLLDATVTGMSSSVGVGGRAEISWSFSGSNLRIEGDDV